VPTYNEPKSYDDGQILTEAMLDEGRDYRATFLNSTKLDSDNIQTGGIATANLADLAVTTAKLGTASVTAAKLAAGATGPDALNNCVVTPSVGSNALTIALKTVAGTDPSSTDPIGIAFRSSTLTSGAYVSRSVTAALSMVVSSGSTLGHTSATEWPIYVYALDNAGTVELAVSTSPVDERYRQSTTAEGGAGAADSVAALYSTTARTNVAVRLIAVLKSTQATAGTWASAPTAVSQPTAPHPIAQAIARPASATAGIGGVAISSSCGAYTRANAVEADVTNLSVTLSTTGRPVWVGLIHDASANASTIGIVNTTNFFFSGAIYFYRDSTSLGRNTYQTGTADANSAERLYVPGTGVSTVDFPAAGTYTYKLTAHSSDGNTTLSISYLKLVAFEL
jgi:hypothetical protein